MAKITSSNIIWDSADFLAGLVPQYDENNTYLYNGIEDTSSFNPFIRLGYASPGVNPADVTNTAEVDGALQRIVIQSVKGKGYGAGGTKVHEITPVSGAITSDAYFPHAVALSTMHDIIRYTVSGEQYLFFSYRTAGGGDIGRVDFSGANPVFIDDFWTGAATLNAAALSADCTHPMIVGADDRLYVGDLNVLKSTDGATAVENALTLPSDFIIRSFSKLGDRTLVIFADSSTGVSSNGETKAYFWDYVSKDPYQIHDIIGARCGGAAEYKGTMAVFTAGLSNDPSNSGRSIHFNIYNGSRFVKQRSFNGTSVSPPTVGGLEVIGDYLKVNIQGTIYSFGSPFEQTNAGNIPIANLSGTSSGAIKTLMTNRTYASSGTTTNGGLQAMYSGIDGSEVAFATASPNFPIGFKGRMDRVRVEFYNEFTTPIRIEISVDTAYGADVLVADGMTLTDTTFFEAYNATNGAALGDFSRAKVKVTWGASVASSSSAFIKRIVIDYTPVKIN